MWKHLDKLVDAFLIAFARMAGVVLALLTVLLVLNVFLEAMQ